jgi:excisionase family DNA binding protein
MTPRELAKLLRVSADRVRYWIRSGQLHAINVATARCGRPRFIILPPHLTEFERTRRAGPAPKPVRRRKRTCFVDYFPDK